MSGKGNEHLADSAIIENKKLYRGYRVFIWVYSVAKILGYFLAVFAAAFQLTLIKLGILEKEIFDAFINPYVITGVFLVAFGQVIEIYYKLIVDIDKLKKEEITKEEELK